MQQAIEYIANLLSIQDIVVNFLKTGDENLEELKTYIGTEKELLRSIFVLISKVLKSNEKWQENACTLIDFLMKSYDIFSDYSNLDPYEYLIRSIRKIRTRSFEAYKRCSNLIEIVDDIMEKHDIPKGYNMKLLGNIEKNMWNCKPYSSFIRNDFKIQIEKDVNKCIQNFEQSASEYDCETYERDVNTAFTFIATINDDTIGPFTEVFAHNMIRFSTFDNGVREFLIAIRSAASSVANNYILSDVDVGTLFADYRIVFNHLCDIGFFKHKYLLSSYINLNTTWEAFSRDGYVDIEDANMYMEYKDLYKSNVEEYRKKVESDISSIEIIDLIIRDDVSSFISYVTETNYNLNTVLRIPIDSMYYELRIGTHSLMEIAVYFGSIQIVRWLKDKGVKLTKSLWKYVFHGNNPEIVHLLEDNHVDFACVPNFIFACWGSFNQTIIGYMIENYSIDTWPIDDESRRNNGNWEFIFGRDFGILLNQDKDKAAEFTKRLGMNTLSSLINQ